MSNDKVPPVLKELVSRVMRTFYDEKCIMVMDVLNKVEWLKEEEIADKILIPNKEISKICNKLKEEGFIHIIARNEAKKPEGRAIPKNFYAIDYPKFVNVTKYRMYMTREFMRGRMDNANQQQYYKCPQCLVKVTVEDALSLMDPRDGSFKCRTCNKVLVGERQDDNAKKGKEKLAKYRDQSKPILELLKLTEEVEYKVTRESISKAMLNKEQTKKSEANGELAYSKDTGGNLTIVNVTFLEDDNASKEEKEAELERRRQQNVLPPWFTKSTIQPMHQNTSLKKADAKSNVQLDINQIFDNEKHRIEKQKVEEENRARYYRQYYYDLNRIAAYNKGEDVNTIQPISSPKKRFKTNEA